MRIMLIVAYTAAILCTACSGGGGPQFDKTDVESISQVIEDLSVAYNAKEPAKAAALYSPSGTVMPPNRSLMRGRQFVEQYYVDRFAEGASDVAIKASDISGQGTLAYATGDYRLNLVPPDGSQPRRDRGKFLWIFRELNGRWMIEYVIFSSDFVALPPGA
jgi:ketosteroid isomerase-like protein